MQLCQLKGIGAMRAVVRCLFAVIVIAAIVIAKPAGVSLAAANLSPRFTPPRPAPHHRPHWGEDGVMLAPMGRPEFPKPVGVYTVLSKDRSVTMDSSSVGVPLTDPAGYRVPVDYAVRITRRGIFVHSAPWAVNSMGLENVSHGCISLSSADAEWYFNTVNIGDPVIVKE
jgi:lipoprotein-anchoring transpeptidase ErfK/SrfK